MNTTFFVRLTALLLFLLLWNCEENPVLLNLPDRTGEINTDTLYATWDNSYRLDEIQSTLIADQLMIGEYENFRARPIMTFTNFLTNIDTILDAWIEFQFNQQIGQGSEGFVARGYPAKEAWIADTSLVWTTVSDGNVDRTQLLGQMLVPSVDFPIRGTEANIVRFRFNSVGLDLVRAWQDSTYFDGDVVIVGQDTITLGIIKNTGMILEFSGANFIREFQGRNTLTNAGIRLHYTYRTTSSTDTLEDAILASSDASIVEGQFTLTESELQERSFVTTFDDPYVIGMTFNLDTLREKYSKGIILESANLQLPVDLTRSKRHPNGAFDPNIRIFPLTSPAGSATVSYDTSFVNNLGADGTIDLNIYGPSASNEQYVQVNSGLERQNLARNYLQRRYNFPSNPDSVLTGFYIEIGRQNQYLAKYSFYRHNDPDPALRPRLIIKSLKLPEERL